jgi:hypothetical protein
MSATKNEIKKKKGKKGGDFEKGYRIIFQY